VVLLVKIDLSFAVIDVAENKELVFNVILRIVQRVIMLDVQPELAILKLGRLCKKNLVILKTLPIPLSSVQNMPK